MAGFRTPVDIVNRALQTCRRARIYTFDDYSLDATEGGFSYDKIRRAELRRNVWRFATRRAILRPISKTSQTITFAAWSSSTAYKIGDVATYSGQVWVAMSDNTGQTPGTVPTTGVLYWDTYFGAMAADQWVSTEVYSAGEVVYTVSSLGVATVYLSKVENNSSDPTAVDAWDTEQLYSSGDVVSYSGTNYQSLQNNNIARTPTGLAPWWTVTVTNPTVSKKWKDTGATLTPIKITYPLGAGPSNDTQTWNIYRLPNGFLRQAPTDPKVDAWPYLGAPTRLGRTDYTWEGNYLVTALTGPLKLRFVADVQDVTMMDDMFCEGLASCIAKEIAPQVADTATLGLILSRAERSYLTTMREARTVNAVEQGSVAPPEDSWVTARL